MKLFVGVLGIQFLDILTGSYYIILYRIITLKRVTLIVAVFICEIKIIVIYSGDPGQYILFMRPK